MEVRLENTASATTNNDPAHCFVAIELSKSSWGLGFSDALGQADQPLPSEGMRCEGAA